MWGSAGRCTGWGSERGHGSLRASDNAVPKYIRVNRFDYVESAHRLYRRMGFTPTRYFDELLRPLDELPVRGVLPGVTILPWPDDRDDEILAVNDSAFADHWGSTPINPTALAHIFAGSGADDLSASSPSIREWLHRELLAGSLRSRRRGERSQGRLDRSTNSARSHRSVCGPGSHLIVRRSARFAADGLTHASIGSTSRAHRRGAACIATRLRAGATRHDYDIASTSPRDAARSSTTLDLLRHRRLGRRTPRRCPAMMTRPAITMRHENVCQSLRDALPQSAVLRVMLR